MCFRAGNQLKSFIFTQNVYIFNIFKFSFFPLKFLLNGLQVNGGVFDRDFTKSLIIRDFDVLKNPFRYVDLFLLHTLLSKKFPKIAMQDL